MEVGVLGSAVVGRKPWGYAGACVHGGYAGGCHGSRGLGKPVVGRRPWGYARGVCMEVMRGDAMEVGVLRSLSWEGGRGDMQGVCRVHAREGISEEVYQRRWGGRKEGRAGTSFEI